jgi:hypothetical protein
VKEYLGQLSRDCRRDFGTPHSPSDNQDKLRGEFLSGDGVFHGFLRTPFFQVYVVEPYTRPDFIYQIRMQPTVSSHPEAFSVDAWVHPKASSKGTAESLMALESAS